MKNKMKIICVFLIIFCLVIFGIIAFNDNKNSIIYTDNIYKKVDNKDDFLVLITDSNNEIGKDIEQIMDYYAKNYNLDILRFYTNKASKKEYQAFLENLDADFPEYIIPMLLIFVDGECKVFINGLFSEENMRSYLIETGLIDDSYNSKDQSIDYEQFEKMYISNDKNLFVLFDNYNETYNIRDNMLEISADFDFKYYSVCGTVSYGASIYSKLRVDAEKDNITVNIPSLVVTQNGKVVDNLNSSDKNEMINFLKKYGFIE